jgi:hypothetical protein
VCPEVNLLRGDNADTLVVLQGEIDTCMKLLGAKTVSDLGPRFVRHFLSQLFVQELDGVVSYPKLTHGDQVNTRMLERDIFDGDAGLDKSGLWTSRAKL